LPGLHYRDSDACLSGHADVAAVLTVGMLVSGKTPALYSGFLPAVRGTAVPHICRFTISFSGRTHEEQMRFSPKHALRRTSASDTATFGGWQCRDAPGCATLLIVVLTAAGFGHNG